MANPVVNINGVSVYSDKSMSGVHNTRVTFADGSWCDVATGEVVNKGPGYINIGSPGSSHEEDVTIGPNRYNATELDIGNVEASVEILPIDGVEIKVSIKGPKSMADAVSVSSRGNTLVIRGKESSGVHVRGSGVVITGGGAFIGGSVSIGGMRGGRITTGNTTVVMSGGGESSLIISIGVPKGTAVKVAGVQGLVTIGDTHGRLQASVLGGDDIKAGKVADASLSVQGSGDIFVASVEGNLSMSVQGSGDIRVRGGTVGNLNVSVMGSGDARFNGEATDASLSVMGSGDIDVGYVKNKPITNVMGHGDINVGNW